MTKEETIEKKFKKSDEDIKNIEDEIENSITEVDEDYDQTDVMYKDLYNMDKEASSEYLKNGWDILDKHNKGEDNYEYEDDYYKNSLYYPTVSENVIYYTPEFDRDEVWDSGIKIIDNPSIKIEREILDICNSIQDKVKSNEFSILCKFEFDEDGIHVLPEYVIPKQEVEGAAVKYKEDLEAFKKKGYGVVIHSHPFESSTFSLSDEETINNNFLASVLYSKGKFTAATICVQINQDYKLKIDVKPSVAFEEYVVDVDTSSIDIVPFKDQYNYKNKNKKKNSYNNTTKIWDPVYKEWISISEAKRIGKIRKQAEQEQATNKKNREAS